MSKLFLPLKIREVEFKNRLAVSPMCQYSAQDGLANDWHFVHLGSRAVGGAALVMTEAVAVSPEGRISPGDLGLWNEEQAQALKRITDFIKANGAVPGIQIAHAGHKASTRPPFEGRGYIEEKDGGWVPLAAGRKELQTGGPYSKELTLAQIEELIQNHKRTAQLALKAGFEVFEIHAAHGYLLNGFLSPLVNSRTDQYGGSFENRIRLLLEIVREVRGIIGEKFPLFVRISATDWVEGAWTIKESVALAKVLKQEGVDLIDCSTGGLVQPSAIPVKPNYQVVFAEEIKKETGIRTAAVGLITEAKQADEIIENQQADLIFMAREFLRDPYFPLHAASILGEEITWPKQYERAKP
ncbi:NADH:flavin oxidoreductase/NADH oxidase [Marinilongibacter aquaticus]|uniref:NADH:flavin oxidoreductase/NADH oxidase n=1 Tax=Marinilongibacter aquaticus TaxID=2975157 RepID=UPI0021BD4F14|nr:NADH:flavin oxidoreductase/NADH oxidase [Marinilongibacter aquaticus]UBM57531.1 NADH:flavin oxidoreductase/NADH oxidase [Marinilongibacter aquaticus]